MNNPDNPEYENLEEILDEAPEEEEEDDAPATGDDEEAVEVDEEEQPDKRIPEKFKGKTAAEIAEAYTNLESHVNTKALAIAKDLMGGKAPSKDAAKKNEVEDDLGLTDEELKNMSPKQFLQHINKTINDRATKIASETITRSTSTRENVRKEIRDVTKAHPHLKTNDDYKNIVLDMIEASNARGEQLTLKQACAKADKAMGIKPAAPAADPAKPKKKLRTAVETTDGPGIKPETTEDDDVRARILGGGKSPGGLKGLGL